MNKTEVPQELAPLSETDMALTLTKQIDISDLMWQTRDEGFVPLKMINDSHLRNIALMLIGMGYQQYNASKELKIRWLTAIQMEWTKRLEERRASKID